MNSADLFSLWLTLKLAVSTVVILFFFATPLAWWLARTNSKLKIFLGTLLALPLVLPPTVLGFYFLLFLSPQNGLGHLLESLGLGSFVFSFTGLLFGSVIYSFPFVLQPIQNAFESINPAYYEVAASLGANSFDRFRTVALPQARAGLLSAAILGFAHTVGEFGVVLMIGGGIPGKTKVLSIAIYDHVEALEYAQAHHLALGLLVSSFVLLLPLYAMKKNNWRLA